MAENTLLANDDPTVPMDLLELRAALAKLPDDQREALFWSARAAWRMKRQLRSASARLEPSRAG